MNVRVVGGGLFGKNVFNTKKRWFLNLSVWSKVLQSRVGKEFVRFFLFFSDSALFKVLRDKQDHVLFSKLNWKYHKDGVNLNGALNFMFQLCTFQTNIFSQIWEHITRLITSFPAFALFLPFKPVQKLLCETLDKIRRVLCNFIEVPTFYCHWISFLISDTGMIKCIYINFYIYIYVEDWW